MLKDMDVQGMFVVEGAAALQQLAERWRRRSTWAFQVLHAPAEPAARGLVLPRLPGMRPLNRFHAPGPRHEKLLCQVYNCGILHVRQFALDVERSDSAA